MSNKTILLVEDSPDDQELTVRAMKKNNIANNLVVARDGVEALDYLFGTGAFAGRDTHSRPGLILIDVNLPRVNGLELLRILRADERTKRIPIVMLTTSREEKDVVTSYSLGANSYIRKPVDYNQFADTVRQLEGYWLALNEVSPS